MAGKTNASVSNRSKGKFAQEGMFDRPVSLTSMFDGSISQNFPVEGTNRKNN